MFGAIIMYVLSEFNKTFNYIKINLVDTYSILIYSLFVTRLAPTIKSSFISNTRGVLDMQFSYTTVIDHNK